MQQSMHASCLFFHHKYGKLQGLLLIHIDDYLSAGTKVFEEEMMSKLRETYVFGNISSGDFYLTGIHIVQNDKMEISIDQNQFLEQIPVFDVSRQDPDSFLDKQENKNLRTNTGQLN